MLLVGRRLLTATGIYKHRLLTMGVESGGRGDASPAVERSAGDVPPEIMILQYLFFSTYVKILHFPTFSK